MRLTLTYMGIFCALCCILDCLPGMESTAWEPMVIIPLTAMLFTLLIFLTCQMARTGKRVEGVVGSALFLVMFFPGASSFFALDEEALMALGSQCIVPFFIGQYNRVSKRDFHQGHLLMLLMGVFCSYTHDGISIPLCVGFLWLAFLNRGRFFRTACWPMVTGFALGTGLCIWNAYREGTVDNPVDLHGLTERTAMAMQILWDTKIFLLTMGVTAWVASNRWGRKLILQTYKEQPLLSSCAMFSCCTLPFAPLGLDNAVTGVCFFCMVWMLCLLRSLAQKFYYDNTTFKTFKSLNR